MNIAVIGTGMVGRLIAVELSKKYQVNAIDNDTTNLNLLKRHRKIITKEMDVKNEDFLGPLEDTEIIINCVPGFMGFETSKKILEKKTCVDISFMPEDCNELNTIAEKAKTALYPDAGVAPGLSNMIIGNLISKNNLKEIKAKYVASGKIELFNKDLQSSKENLKNGLRYVYFSSSIAAVFGIIISILMFPKFELLRILIRKKANDELSKILNVSSSDVIAFCLELGSLATINQRLDWDVIELIANHFEFKAEKIEDATEELFSIEDTEEDKISKRAAIEKLEPMEIVQKYTNDFRNVLGLSLIHI